MNTLNFQQDEVESTGRRSRVSRPTPAMLEFRASQQRLAESRERRASSKSNPTPIEPTPSVQLTPAPVELTPSTQSTPVPVEPTLPSFSGDAEDSEVTTDSDADADPEVAAMDDFFDRMRNAQPNDITHISVVTPSRVPSCPTVSHTPVERIARRLPRRAHMVPPTPSPLGTQARLANTLSGQAGNAQNQIAGSDKENNSPAPVVAGTKRLVDSVDSPNSDAADPSPDPGNDDDETAPRLSGHRISDVAVARQRIVNAAYAFFRKLLLAFHTFPNKISCETMATQAYYYGNAYLRDTFGLQGITDPVTIEIGLICDRAPQLRGKTKTKARNAIVDGTATGYKFLDANDDDSKAYNRNLYNTLKRELAFVYKNPMDTSEKGSLFRNESLFTTVKKVFFDDGEKSEGLRVGFFEDEMIPLPAIALVVTALECALDEWQSGQRKKVNFTSKSYEDIYNTHLKSLENWDLYSRNRNAATVQLQKDLYRAGVLYAGVSNPDGSLYQQTPSLTVAAFAMDE